MSGLFGTLNTATKGLMAQQTALHTTSHNISNANTKGFSRQRVDLKADLAFTLGGVGQLGTGVRMTGIVRLVDDYVTKQIRTENGTMTKFQAKSEVMEQLEIIFNEPSDTSLNFNLGEMFDSWQELSKNPESLNSKTIVVEKAKTLADTLNHIANQINSLKDDTNSQIEKSVTDLNSIVSNLDTLNKQIFNISVKGHVPNDLLDQRDLMLQDLSAITNFDTSFDKYGRVEVSIGGTPIKGEIKVGDLENLNITSGTLKGNKDAVEDLNLQKENLDKFTATMATAINTVHGTDFFVNSNSSEGIKVSAELQADNSKVNAGKEVDGPEGDGSRALAIARLRNTKIDFTGNTPLNYNADTMEIENQAGGITIEGAYNNIVTKVGITKEHSDNMVANQEILLDQLILRRESTSGVQIDEEVTNVIKFQKSFEANSKVISVLAEMLDVLINRTGV